MGTNSCAGMATVVDNVLDEQSISQLLRQFEGSALEPGARTVLPFIDVPCKLDRRIRQILHRQLSGTDHTDTDDTDSAALGQPEPSPRENGQTVRMPGRLARGSSAMHVDTGFDQNDSPVDLKLSGLVCVLYLDGDGHLVIDDGSGVEQSIPVTRGRLVLWPNDTCIHRLDAGNNSRAMIGPMNLSADGVWNRAGDQYSSYTIQDPTRVDFLDPYSQFPKNRRIGDEGLAELATDLATNTIVRQINLSETGITDKGLAKLATALTTNTSITDIILNKYGGTPSMELCMYEKQTKYGTMWAHQAIDELLSRNRVIAMDLVDLTGVKPRYPDDKHGSGFYNKKIGDKGVAK